MGAFKIQTDLDLSGFNLLNFCIQSYTDLENVPNLGLGRKLFFTGNSTDEKNLREVIWDGVEWKAAAYLDDIEAITNGEGSLGTRVKALEDMLGLEDVTDVIDTWNNVKAFFDNVDEGLTLMTMLDGKAEWAERIPDLSFKHIGYGYAGQGFWTSGPALSFGANANYFGQIQMDIMPVPTIKIRSYNKGYGEWQTLIHSGNVGEYALKYAGVILPAESELPVLNSFGLWHTVGPYIRFGTTEAYNITIRSYSNKLQALMNASEDGDWKTIAFTDSDITGNAATATKLKTAVSLWGNEFDGTKDLSGNIFLPSGKGIRWMLGEVELDNISVGTAGSFNLGYGSAINGYASYINGTPIYFRTGKASPTTAMTITEEGHVNVGGAYLLDALFSVRGLTSIFVSGSGMSLDGLPENGLVLGGTAYTLAQFLQNSGNFAIQSYRKDTASVLDLNLNPLGGAVNVGEGGLNVNGTIKSGDKFILTTTSMNLGSATTPLYFFLARPDANYIWASAKGGYINLGVYDTGTTNSANATLSIYSDRVVSGQRNNAVSLGTSSYRWSDVYSVNGDFSGRVLIGGAVDDANYALKVNGALGVNGNIDLGAHAIGVNLSSGWTDSAGKKHIWYGLDLSDISNAVTLSGYYGLILKTNTSYGITLDSKTLDVSGVSSFSNRVLIGGVADDKTSALNVKGTTRVEDIVSCKGGTEWASGFKAIDPSRNVLGDIGYHVKDNALIEAYIGASFSRTWFTINSTESNFNVLTKFNAGALIPTGQTLTIGSVTFRETATGEVEVDGNLHTTGTLASGGKGEAGENTTGNAMVYQYELESGQSSYDVQNVKNNTNVIVQVYEWNGNTSSWDMILTDVSVKASGITVTFGRATTVNHLVTVC